MLILMILSQLSKTDSGIKVTTDHGEEIVVDVVLFATGECHLYY